MKNCIYNIFFIPSLLFLWGCSPIAETVKKVWGSSTQALENARSESVSKVYSCDFDQCFDAVLSLGRNEPKLKSTNKKFFDIFLKDPVKGHIVVMGILGNVNTTEVGIFFTPVSDRVVKLDISSLSTTAKEKVAKAVFDELNLHFSEIH